MSQDPQRPVHRSTRLQQALNFAVLAHAAAGQKRAATDFPSVAHPIRVAEILTGSASATS